MVELEGVELEPTAQVGGAALQLNGAGLRTRAIFKVHVAGLYVPQKSADAGALLAQKGPRGPGGGVEVADRHAQCQPEGRG